MIAIHTDKLTKRFGKTVAVDDVSITVKEGEIYGFLGLNGAGKTTTIRLLLGMIRPDSGSISLFEKNPQQASRIWNDVGYLVETPFAYPNLTVKENLEVFYRLRGLTDKALIDNIISVLHLGQYQDRKAKHLSLGNKQRLGLAKALLHRPKLLILDEPINGLDPAGIVEIREFLKELVTHHGTTIFLSSHILSEIARIATRIGIVHNGKLIRELNTAELEHQIIKKLRIGTSDNNRAVELLKDANITASLNGEEIIESSDRNAIAKPEAITAMLAGSGLPPKMIHVIEEDLEAYFLRMIGN